MEPFPAAIEEQPHRHHEDRTKSTLTPLTGDRPRAASTSKVTSSHRRTSSTKVLSRLAHSLRVAPAVDSSLNSGTAARPRGQSHPDSRSSALHGESTDALTSHSGSRRRKGSLRKTAIMGPGTSTPERRPSKSTAAEPSPTSPRWSSWPRSDPKERRHTENPDKPSTDSLAISLPIEAGHGAPRTSGELLSPDYIPVTARGSPLTSPSTAAYASTTDEDEGLMLPTHTALANLASSPASGVASSAKGGHMPSPSPSSSESSATAPSTTLQHRRSTGKLKSPLAAASMQHADLSTLSADDEWDYSVTAWWGWAILVVTWVVFVVGMGSCFDVWTWAWDVGETPAAPPQLKSDPTLPIVGYYPALIVLTGVMSWSWVLLAWVGMKYFKHAKMAS